MQNKFFTLLLNCLLALFVFAVPVLAETETEPSTETNETESTEVQQATDTSSLAGLVPAHYSGAYLSIGAQYNNLTGSQDRVSEYIAAPQGTRPTGRAAIWGYKDGFAYDLYASRGASAADQDYSARIDLKRYWKSELEFNKLPHRLITDPLTNLDAAKGGPMVQYTANDAGMKYCPVYQDLQWKNDIVFPGFPMLSLHFDYRNQQRKGSIQGRTMSHCSTCHVESFATSMDQETEEFRTGLTLGTAKANVRYEFLNRELVEGAATPLYLFDEVQHPVNQSRVFTNRAQFEEMDGPLPFNQVPNFKKNRHYLRGYVSVPKGGGEVVGTYVADRADNSSYGYGVDTQVASGYYGVNVGKNSQFTFKVRNLDTDSDSIFVEVNDRPADAGPQAGKIFKEIYTTYGETDFLQHSSLEREIFTMKVDWKFMLPRRTIFRLGYEHENLERPRYEVSQTRTNRATVSFSSRPNDNFNLRFKYEYAEADTPFAHIHAALPPSLQPYPSPNNSPFTGLQYFTVYRARQIDMSNYPATAHDLTASATWSPSDRFSLTAHVRGKKHSNDELTELYDWSDMVFAPTIELWAAPSDRVDILASYSLQKRETDSLFGIAVYDG